MMTQIRPPVVPWALRRPDLVGLRSAPKPPVKSEGEAPPPPKYHAYDFEFTKPFLVAVMRAVTKFYGVSAYRISGKRRTGDVIIPRLAFYILAHELTPAVAGQIGKFVNRDRTSVIHGFSSKPIRDIETVRCLARQEIRKIKRLPLQPQLPLTQAA